MRTKRFGQVSPREALETRNATYLLYGMNEHIKELPPRRERVKRPVDGRPVGPSEHQEQSAVISWWYLAHGQYRIPIFALFAVPNGGARDPITGSRLKAEGVRRGALDLILAKPNKKYHGLFLEMKVGSNKPTDEQTAFIDYLKSSGYDASVHWDSGSAIEAIKRYLGYDETMALLPA